MSNLLLSNFEKAKTLLNEGNEGPAFELFKTVVLSDETTEDSVKAKEEAVNTVGDYLSKHRRAQDLAEFLRLIKPFLASVSKAKMSKIVRIFVDLILDIENSEKIVYDVCVEFIEIAKEQKNAVLRQRLEFKLSTAEYLSANYQEALAILNKLLLEVRKLDDKPLLVESYLLESKIHHGLFNLSRARASLTAAKTNANEMYVQPSLQAELDLTSGKLHADENDYKTAYSYFYESYENYEQASSPKSTDSLKYMLLCKIISGGMDEVQGLINGKLVLKYAEPELVPMKDIAKAHANHSLKEFQEVIEKHKEELSKDTLITRHLSELYETLLENNLLKIIEPYSNVQVTHIASILELTRDNVEQKLSQMILDKKLKGILDQGTDSLIVFDEPDIDGTYQAALDTLGQMDKVVASLYNRSLKLS